MSVNCRFCHTPLTHSFVDLGMSPLSNAYVKAEQLNDEEVFYPLHAYVCSQCLLVQIAAFSAPEHIFKDYAYFSSFSSSWLAHAKDFVTQVIPKLQLNAQSHVVEIASNDGYLLQYFPEDFQRLGIEPAENVAEVARQKGIPTRAVFFGTQTAQNLREEGIHADLIVANNVLAHVPDLNDFVAGLALLITPQGTISIEVPHLLHLYTQNQFDTIYHEHYSYFSLLALQQIFAAHQLSIYDVEHLSTHGGSLRLSITPTSNRSVTPRPSVAEALQSEKATGLDQLQTYLDFAARVKALKLETWQFFIDLQRQGKRIAAYGAPAKGNTFLNYCGIGRELLPFCVDKSPHKQGLYLPGSHIPILAPEALYADQPDYILILPWNLQAEISEQLAACREWGAQFVTAIPSLTVHP